MKTLWEKLKAILGSIRFWIVTLGMVVAVLEAIASGATNTIPEIIMGWLGIVVGIGTVDKLAETVSRK